MVRRFDMKSAIIRGYHSENRKLEKRYIVIDNETAMNVLDLLAEKYDVLEVRNTDQGLVKEFNRHLLKQKSFRGDIIDFLDFDW